MSLRQPFESFESVQTWGSSLARQWGGDPLVEQPEKMATLAAFCAFIDKDPDELAAFCFLRRRATGERFASVKRRNAVAEQLREFKKARGVSGLKGRQLVAEVLSFLVHNGVMMHAGMV